MPCSAKRKALPALWSNAVLPITDIFMMGNPNSPTQWALQSGRGLSFAQGMSGGKAVLVPYWGN